MRLFPTAFTRFVLPLIGLFSSLRAADQPNVLIIFTDDLGYGDISAYRPNADIRTPHVDRLAAEGMLFTRMRANATVCSPSRAALLTGRYADRAGMPGLIRGNRANTWGYFDPTVPTLANELHELGYHTCIVGKWNLGLSSPNLPNERGFDLFHGFLEDMMDSYTTHLRHGTNFMRRNYEVVDPKGHATEIFTDWACDYMRERAMAKQPFFLYLAYNAPHFPIQPPPEWLERVKKHAPRMEEKRALNVAFVEHLDSGVGRVLSTLQQLGLERNTIVVFTSDNGGYLPVAANNDPWRGGKRDHYDGGLCVPFIMRWPGEIAPGSRSDYAGLVFDVFATAIQAAGGTPPGEIDAVSLMPVLHGEKLPPSPPRELYFVRRDGGPEYGGKSYEALIRGDWKLMQNDPYSPLEMYNLARDPQERNNVIDQNPKLTTELRNALRAHIQAGGATPWQPPSRDRPLNEGDESDQEETRSVSRR
jgi:arylsulfatase A-like enzyme